ncbi:glycosyltransferase family 2 protein [Kamptonema formosum]|uniref:glycosyltransferase family 2 protein n=1 Tax=Kamptonema formosum TaxID=331992 RepID=UPI000367C9A4|nr:glycosyltransferase family 2 protein [Oscillatoria sp. PCC 10802]
MTVSGYRVAAYITAYEEPKAIETCVAAIQNQSILVENIFIVDNSRRHPITWQDRGKIWVEYRPENIGVSGGVRRGLEWAIEGGYDFLWAFDQDSVPAGNCLERLLQTYKSESKPECPIGIVGPTAIDPRTNWVIEGSVFERDAFLPRHPPSSTEPYECDAPITSGSLISLKAAKMTAPPRDDLFIDGIDMDYGLRLKLKGFRNLIVPDAILYHQFGNPIQGRFGKRDIFLQKYPPLRHYYICRNHTYLALHYARGWHRASSILRRLKYMAHTMILVGMYDPEPKSLKLWACLLGTFHGIVGRLGKVWQ